MVDNYTLAGSGLRTMFRAQILAIVGMIFTFIPIIGVLGAVAVLVGGVMSLVGLYKAGPAHPMFMTAFIATVISIAIDVVKGFFSEENLFHGVLSLASGVAAFVALYCVCCAAAELIEVRGNYELAQSGRFIWKLNLACIVVVAVCTVLAFVPLLNLLAIFPVLVAGIASLVGGILYLVFLYRASNYLLNE